VVDPEPGLLGLERGWFEEKTCVTWQVDPGKLGQKPDYNPFIFFTKKTLF